MSTCANHPGEPARGACAACRTDLCSSCLISFQGEELCGPCRDDRLRRLTASGPAGLEGFLESAGKQLAFQGKCELAVGAFYLGLIALLPCTGRLVGPAAVVLGILGLRAALRERDRSGVYMAAAGLSLGAVAALVYWGLTFAGFL